VSLLIHGITAVFKKKFTGRRLLVGSDFNDEWHCYFS